MTIHYYFHNKSKTYNSPVTVIYKDETGIPYRRRKKEDNKDDVGEEE